MFFLLIATIVAQVIIAVIAGWAVHRFTRRRNRDAVRLEHGIECLSKAYLELSAVCLSHSKSSVNSLHLDKILDELLLFGNAKVVQNCQMIRSEIADGATEIFTAASLIKNLQSNIREELGLPIILDPTTSPHLPVRLG